MLCNLRLSCAGEEAKAEGWFTKYSCSLPLWIHTTGIWTEALIMLGLVFGLSVIFVIFGLYMNWITLEHVIICVGRLIQAFRDPR